MTSSKTEFKAQRGSGGRLFRRFRKDAGGATAIEFAAIALPFTALMFAIIETALLFFAQQTLETAVADSARLIRTGQAQKQSYNLTTFKTDICNRIGGLFNCEANLKLDVRTTETFDSVNLDKPVNDDGELETDDFSYVAGKGGDIVVVRAFYEWPTFVHLLGLNYSNLANGKHLLSATSAFKNEPFPW
jgi:Flp pilus assembly protein TadG